MNIFSWWDQDLKKESANHSKLIIGSLALIVKDGAAKDSPLKSQESRFLIPN